MNGYHAFVIGEDRHLIKRMEIICENDEEAKRRARQLVDGHAIELWQEARMIETFDPE